MNPDFTPITLSYPQAAACYTHAWANAGALTRICRARCNTRFFRQARDNNHEAHLSAIENAPQAHTRISGTYENESRPRRHQRAQG
jgi:hypothetical protein